MTSAGKLTEGSKLSKLGKAATMANKTMKYGDDAAKALVKKMQDLPFPVLDEIALAGGGTVKVTGKGTLGDAMKLKKANFSKGSGAVDDVAKEASKAVEKASGANTLSKYDDIYSYKYNGYDNPGPLNEIKGQPNKNFYGGRYDVEVLTEPKVLYRAGDSTNPLGQWFTETPPNSVANVRIDTAVKPQWIDNNGILTGTSNIDTVYKIEIPAGTTIYSGPVGNQGGMFQGGLNTNQIFINKPWELGDKVIILDSSPLK